MSDLHTLPGVTIGPSQIGSGGFIRNEEGELQAIGSGSWVKTYPPLCNITCVLPKTLIKDKDGKRTILLGEQISHGGEFIIPESLRNLPHIKAQLEKHERDQKEAQAKALKEDEKAFQVGLQDEKSNAFIYVQGQYIDVSKYDNLMPQEVVGEITYRITRTGSLVQVERMNDKDDPIQIQLVQGSLIKRIKGLY